MNFDNGIHEALRQENIKLAKANAELSSCIRLLQGMNEAAHEEVLKMRQANEELVRQHDALREELDDLKRALKRAEDGMFVALEMALKD